MSTAAIRANVGAGKSRRHSRGHIWWWCSGAATPAIRNKSRRKWQAALAHNKDLLPLLLDATPFPGAARCVSMDRFSRYGRGRSHGSCCAPSVTPAPAPQMPKAPRSAPAPFGASRWLAFAALVAVFALAALLNGHLADKDAPRDLPPLPADTRPVPPAKPPSAGTHRPKPTPPKATAGPPPPAPSPAQVYLWPALTSLAASAVVLFWLWRRKRRHTAATAPSAATTGATPPAREVEKAIASRLEAEILRRAAVRREA